MLLKRIDEFVKFDKNLKEGVIEVWNNGDLILDITFSSRKELKEQLEWIQKEVIFNINNRYSFLSNKEIDIDINEEFVASYIVNI